MDMDAIARAPSHLSRWAVVPIRLGIAPRISARGERRSRGTGARDRELSVTRWPVRLTGMSDTFDLDIAEWIDAGPSRRLRKAYAALAAINAEIERVRRSNPIPDHAPSSLMVIRHRLRPLLAERDRAERRILRMVEPERP